MIQLCSDRLDSIVIDLRNNGGGVLQAAVDVATLFLPPGKIVTFVVGKDGLQDALQTLPNGITSNDPNLPDLKTKLYLLVNDQTASAAEVLTAGLKVRIRREYACWYCRLSWFVGEWSIQSDWKEDFWKRDNSESSRTAARRHCRDNLTIRDTFA